MALGGGVGRAPRWRWAVLAGLAVSGCVASFWMAHEFKLRVYAAQETAFQRDAAERANRVADAFVPPGQQLLTVQRLFHANGQVDWDLFRRFVEPFVRPGAARLIAWVPLVRDGDRGRFENEGRRLWGNDFAIHDGLGVQAKTTAPTRDRYFPLLYRLVDVDNRPAPGFDLAANLHDRLHAHPNTRKPASRLARDSSGWLSGWLGWFGGAPGGVAAGLALAVGLWLGGGLLPAAAVGQATDMTSVRVFDPVPPGGLCAAPELCRMTRTLP